MAKAATKKPTAKKTAAKKTTKKAVVKETAVDTVEAAPKEKTTMLDMNDIEVKRMIAVAKKSGLLATSELNKHLNSDEVTPDQIEVTLSELSEL